MKEVWKNIENTNGQYQISNLGNVRSKFRYFYDINAKTTKKIYREKYILPRKDKKGYLRVQIYINDKLKNISIHKLVANAFLNKNKIKKMSFEKTIDFDKIQVNHIDTNKKNNNVENLEFCTNAYNHYHSEKFENGLKKSKKVVLYKGNEGLEFISIRKAHDFLGISISGKYKKYINTQKEYKGYLWKYKEDMQ